MSERPVIGGMDKRPLIRELQIPRKRNYWLVKRAIDIFLSLTLLALASPIMLLLMLAIVIDDPKGGPIFRQLRCGRGGKPFYMYKLRSMHVNAEAEKAKYMELNEMKGPVFKIKRDPRITRVGRLIRATGLDELPQFFNILRGDMVFVGPRPPLPDEVKLYNEYQFQRLYVTPGLTCYWQIAPNRNSISFDEWVEMDVQYVIDRTFWVDLKIIAKTVMAVLRHSGE